MFTVHCKRVRKTKNYEILFSYNLEFIEKVKALPFQKRKYISSTKTWVLGVLELYGLIQQYKGRDDIFFNFVDDGREMFLSVLKENLTKALKEEELLNELEKQKKIWVEYKNELSKHVDEYKPIFESKLNEGVSLRNYQIETILYANKIRNILLALDMGCGKTIVSITFCEYNDFEKCLIVTPNNLKFNYGNEINKFTKSKYYIVGAKKNKYTADESKYVIVNYDFFRSSDYRNVVKKINKEKINFTYDVIVCDEAHKLKNSSSNTFINFSKFVKDKKGMYFDDFNNVPKLFLSGTPAPNRAYELYNVLNMISPLEFKTKTDFQNQYCGIKYDFETGRNVFNPDDVDIDGLFNKISPYVFRKKKSEVQGELPPKTVQIVYLEMTDTQRAKYNEIVDNTIRTYLGDYVKKNQLSILVDIRKYLSEIKMNYIVDTIDTIYEAGEKVVIADIFKYRLYDLHKKIGDTSVVYSGDIKSVDERNEIIKKFMTPNSGLNCLLGIVDVIKEGLTLTIASKLICVSPLYVPGDLDQLGDRLHRMGQIEPVFIYLPIFLDTIEEKILDIMNSKKTEIIGVIDGVKYVPEITESSVEELMDFLIKNRRK